MWHAYEGVEVKAEKNLEKRGKGQEKDDEEQYVYFLVFVVTSVNEQLHIGPILYTRDSHLDSSELLGSPHVNQQLKSVIVS